MREKPEVVSGLLGVFRRPVQTTIRTRSPNAKRRREVIESAGPAGATLQVLQEAQEKRGMGEAGDSWD